jgi:hypothetical protein
VHPFKTRVLNLLNSVSEMNVAIGYFLYILFIVDIELEDELIARLIIGSMVTTYVIHNILIVFNIIKLIIQILRQKCSRRQIPTLPFTALIFVNRQSNAHTK